MATHRSVVRCSGNIWLPQFGIEETAGTLAGGSFDPNRELGGGSFDPPPGPSKVYYVWGVLQFCLC